MKVEIVDICRPTDIIDEEIGRLKEQGFFITGQHGGGDYGSSLVLKKGETKEEIEQVKEESEQHKEFVKEYWDWHNKISIIV